jgi:hypothetical protein
MKAVSDAGASSEGYRVVLVLEGEHAYWFKWSEGVLLASVVESLHGAGSLSTVSCPWVERRSTGNLQAVELVLNSSMDELDRVALQNAPSGLIRPVQMARLMGSLRKNYPRSSRYRLPECLHPDAASIMHHLIPGIWEQWLQCLQEGPVLIRQVMTASELLQEALDSLGEATLYAYSVGQETCHLLVMSHAPVYMRSFSTAATISVNATANDNRVASHDRQEQGAQPETFSAEHVNAAYIQAQADGVENTGELAEIRKTLEYISDALLPAGMPVQVVLLQSALKRQASCGSGTAYELSALCVKAVNPSVNYCWADASLVALELKDVEPLGSGNRKCTARFWWKLKRATRRIYSLFTCQTTSHHCVTRYRRLATDALTASARMQGMHLRMECLRRATLLSAVMATATLCAASVNGVLGARLKAQHSADQLEIEVHIEQLKGQFPLSTFTPGFVSRSITRMEQHKLARPVDVSTLMATVADAVSRYPQLILDTLSWSVIHQDLLLDQGFQVNQRITGRERLWDEKSSRLAVQIEIAGTVAKDHGLREQQSVLHSFVAYLESLPGVRYVSVLESPVQAARSSELLVENGSSYRLSMVMGTS